MSQDWRRSGTKPEPTSRSVHRKAQTYPAFAPEVEKFWDEALGDLRTATSAARKSFIDTLVDARPEMVRDPADTEVMREDEVAALENSYDLAEMGVDTDTDRQIFPQNSNPVLMEPSREQLLRKKILEAGPHSVIEVDNVEDIPSVVFLEPSDLRRAFETAGGLVPGSTDPGNPENREKMKAGDSPFHFDSGKPRMDQLPPRALMSVAAVFGYGANKYGEHNWARYADNWKWGQMIGSMLRHIFAWMGGEDIDPESNLPHLSHAGCNILMLLELIIMGQGQDDRNPLHSRDSITGHFSSRYADRGGLNG